VTARHLTVQECADRLAVDHKTMRRLIDRGELPALRVGRVLRIDPDDLEALRYRPRGGPGAARTPRSRPPAREFARLARDP
jgi:excisionase family DNA binding protein